MLQPAKDDLLSDAFVCRHEAGSWNAVSADQFGEQTAIKIGKGDLSSTQIAKWNDSFSDTLDHCYSPDLSSSFNLDLNSPRPSREAVMKNKHNKRGLLRLLSTFNLGCVASVESRDDGVFLHDETYTTIISYLCQTTDARRQVVRIRAAGLLDVALRYTGSCCCDDGEVGWCCP